MTTNDLINELQKYSSKEDALFLQRYFKTGKGQYGEGDILIGVRVPNTRKVCQKFRDLPLLEIKELLESKIHEHRLAGVILLNFKYKKGDATEKKAICDLYMHELASENINNWDIVDVSCANIVGEYSKATDRQILTSLAKSKNIWERRVAIISTAAYIKEGDSKMTLEISDILLHDKQDLIHKAVGWMLREVGKRVSEKTLTDYLEEHASVMPRVMLRYACEKLSPEKRSHYYGQRAR